MSYLCLGLFRHTYVYLYTCICILRGKNKVNRVKFRSNLPLLRVTWGQNIQPRSYIYIWIYIGTWNKFWTLFQFRHWRVSATARRTSFSYTKRIKLVERYRYFNLKTNLQNALVRFDNPMQKFMYQGTIS